VTSLPIVRLQFFTIRTHDLLAARRFYVDRLGFDIISEKAGEYVQVAIAGVPVCVDAEVGRGPQQPNQIGLEVSDLQQTIRYLQKRGLSVATGETGTERWASVKDPDGHEILFITAPEHTGVARAKIR
jgi:catechol 2,3-dioxygenase-like lactoylglutathione lyase family enzyme